MSLTHKLILSAAIIASLCAMTNSFADAPSKPVSVAVSATKVSAVPAEGGVKETLSNLWHKSLASVSSIVRGTNPVAVVASPSTLPATTNIGDTYAITYTLTNMTPGAKTINNIGFTVTGSGFSVNGDNCNNAILQQNGTCHIGVEFQPTSAGSTSAQVHFQYGNTVIPITPVLSTTVLPTSEDVTGSVTGLPGTTYVGSEYTGVTFTFFNSSGTQITGASNAKSGSSDFVITSNGCGSTLNAHTSCSIVGTFTPAAAGDNQTMTETFSYGSVHVAVTGRTNVNASSGGCADVGGSNVLVLPTNTYAYADNVVKFRFTNHCPSGTSATLGTVVPTASLGSGSTSKAVYRKGAPLNTPPQDVTSWVITSTAEDGCSGQTLAGGAYCDVLMSVVPNGTGGPLSVTATVPYTESTQSKQAVSTTTSNLVQANNSTDRVITLVNQCPFNVWPTFQAGAVPNVANCTTLNNCPSNSTCLTTADAGNGLCYWDNPSIPGGTTGPHGGGFLAQAVTGQAPDTVDITVPETNGGSTLQQNILYNAGIAVRLGCTGTPGTSGFSCTQNNCGGTDPMGTTGSDGMCVPGVGVTTSPGMSFNAVEFTFLRAYTPGATDGVYDQQTINGVNVPMEMKGRGSLSVGSKPFYNCPGAGAVIQPTAGLDASNTLGGCNYNYTTPAGYDPANYKFVTSPGVACDEDNPCSSGICGISYTGPSPGTDQLTRTCGTFNGYVSVNTGICSRSSASFQGEDLYTDYACGTTQSGAVSSNADLYACGGDAYAGTSCYTQTDPTTKTTCCGCQDWHNTPASLVVPTATKSCLDYQNPFWGATSTTNTGIVLPQILWVKSACPTAYAYQYDDPSSQFYCTVTNSANTQIVTNYQVTFCPGGKYLTGE